MIIDRKGRIFGKISIIDILIIIIVVVGVWLFYRNIFSRHISLATAQTDNIRITFTSIGIPEELANRIKKGDAVKEMNTGNFYGKVTDVILKDAPFYGNDSKGRIVLSAKPGHKVAVVVVEGKGRYYDSKAYFGNVEYYLNENSGLVAGRVVFWASVTDITKY